MRAYYFSSLSLRVPLLAAKRRSSALDVTNQIPHPFPYPHPMRTAIAQIAPVFLDRARTAEKIASAINDACKQGAQLVAFAEALLPGYPAWLENTNATRFDDRFQKELHALYLDQAVDTETNHLDPIRDAARTNSCAVVLGVVERPRDRGSHSLYCTALYIDPAGDIQSAHRKLQPTYDERLVWAPGDAHGLRTHKLHGFTVGALNCWENWMPLARAAMQAQGMNMHVMIWPGSPHNTKDITRFVAREGRSYAVSASALLRKQDVPDGFPAKEQMFADTDALYHGGSAVAGPDGEWIIEPVADQETILTFDADPAFVRRERQNFDPAGHYARPDALKLTVNRARLTSATIIDD